MNHAYLSFNGGEISPYGYHRTDLDKHATGASFIENFLPMPFGGLRKRPGTLYLADLGVDTRIEAFKHTSGVSYILALSAAALKIYRADGTLAESLALAIENPFKVQILQLNDVIFLTERALPPQRLTRIDDTTWTLEPIPFTSVPLAAENTDESKTLEIVSPFPAWLTSTAYAVDDSVQLDGATYTCYTAHTSSASNKPASGSSWLTYWRLAVAPTATVVTLQAAGHTPFTIDDIGSSYQLSYKRTVEDFRVTKVLSSADGTSPILIVFGDWNFRTYGIWHGDISVEQSTDYGSTWEVVKTFGGSGDRNVDTEGTTDTLVLMRLNWQNSVSGGASNPRATLEAVDPYIPGIVKITAVTDSDTATATVSNPILYGTTEIWAPGAFSASRGYPAAIAFHQSRLIFAGTTRDPNSLWFSKVDDFLNFKTGTKEDDSMLNTLASTRQENILWMLSEAVLIIGTEGSEWVAGHRDKDEPLTPENSRFRRVSSYGSDSIPAIQSKSSVLFIQRQGRRVREFTYSYESESYTAPDLTRLAEHITLSGIKQLAYQPNREAILWAVLHSGSLLAFNYSREEGIASWTRSSSGDGFHSVTTNRNETDDDDVFFVIRRAEGWHLEKLAPAQQSIQEAGDLPRCIHLDAATTVTHLVPSNTLSGIPAILDFETLTVLADGDVLEVQVVDQEITLDAAYTTITAGLPYTGTITTLPLDVSTDRGPTHSMLKTANTLILDLYQSYGGSISYLGHSNDIQFDNTDVLGLTPPLYTGWSTNTLAPGHQTDLTFTLTHSSPHPFTLRAAILKWTPTGN